MTSNNRLDLDADLDYDADRGMFTGVGLRHVAVLQN